MSNQRTKSSPTLSFDGFGGVDKTRGHSDPASAAEILNFRVRKDGSLQKRCGYRLLADVGAPIRSHWSGKMGGQSYLFLSTDDTVLSVDPVSGELRTVAPLPTPSEAAVFFFYRNALYLLNGERFYRVTEDALTEVNGYVPLLGKDWNNRAVGEIYEPRNILTRRARISYIISSPVSMFLALPDELESVERVEINGEEIDPERYRYDTNFKTVNVTELNADDRVTIYVTFANGYPRLFRELCSCRFSTTFGGPTSNRLFFWGGEASTTMFSSAYVRQERVEEAQRYDPDCSPLYFPPGFEFTVGEGRHPVQGAQRHYDRLLIFTEGDTWIANSESSGLDDFPTFGINACIGCASPHGTALAENDPVTVGEYAVWQWSGETDRLSERNAIRLSDAIDPLLAPVDYLTAQLYYNRRENELWMNLPLRDEVWICQLGRRQWYRFGGIRADLFFDLGSDVAFLREDKVFVFDETLSADLETPTEEKPILASYVSTVSDFGTEEKKNLSRLTLRGDLGGATLTLTFSANGIEDVECVLSGRGGTHDVLERRLSSGSFRCGSVRITSEDDRRPVIHSLILSTR